MAVENSGGSCSYYIVHVPDPISGDDPYNAECLDVIENLEMTPHESNVFKALWRKAAERQGKKKKGNSALRDAQKIAFISARILHNEERKWK
jgi:hypothetical protein